MTPPADPGLGLRAWHHLRPPTQGADVTNAEPGPDEITLTAPEGRPLCHDRAHRDLGRPAEVIVTFGQFGTPDLPRAALWRECWGRSYPMCATCWDTTRQVVQKARTHLVIRGSTQP
jgi:hypothetical protein